MVEIEVSIAQLEEQGLGVSTRTFQRWLEKNGFSVVRVLDKSIVLTAEEKQRELGHRSR